jgi:hypothetical protein
VPLVKPDPALLLLPRQPLDEDVSADAEALVFLHDAWFAAADSGLRSSQDVR